MNQGMNTSLVCAEFLTFLNTLYSIKLCKQAQAGTHPALGWHQKRRPYKVPLCHLPQPFDPASVVKYGVSFALDCLVSLST